MPKGRKILVEVKQHRLDEKAISAVLEKVYTAGWKQNKAKVINLSNQMSVGQGVEELVSMFLEAMNESSRTQ